MLYALNAICEFADKIAKVFRKTEKFSFCIMAIVLVRLLPRELKNPIQYTRHIYSQGKMSQWLHPPSIFDTQKVVEGVISHKRCHIDYNMIVDSGLGTM